MRQLKKRRTPNAAPAKKLPNEERLSHAQVARECEVGKATVHEWHKEGLSANPSRAEVMHFLAHRKGYAPDSQRERLARAQSEKVELDNERRGGRLIETAIVSRILGELGADLKVRHDGLAGRVANEFAGSNDPAQIRTRLLEELRAVRGAFADATDKVADALGGLADAGEEQPSAAAADR